MSCPGLTPEDYQLYALGLCETPEAETIRAHVADGCGVCGAELKQSVVLWYQFALAETEESQAQPRPDLRSKILENITAIPIGPPRRTRWSRQQAIAAAVALVVASALSWYIGNRGFLQRSRPAPIVIRQAPPAQAQEDVRALRDRLEKAEQALAKRPPSPAPEPPALQAALTEARRVLTQTQQTLAEQQARTAALQTELQTQRNLLAAAIRERQDAEVRAAAVADERNRQVRALTSRIQQLERDNAEFRTIIDRERREAEQNLRLANLLSSPNLRMARLQSTEKGAAAVGYAFIEGSRVIFYASRLPVLPAGRTYQLWLIRGRAPAIVSGGLFTGGGQQRSIIEFTDPQLVSNITALAVTDEPAGGSPLPTGHKFLVGPLRG